MHAVEHCGVGAQLVGNNFPRYSRLALAGITGHGIHKVALVHVLKSHKDIITRAHRALVGRCFQTNSGASGIRETALVRRLEGDAPRDQGLGATQFPSIQLLVPRSVARGYQGKLKLCLRCCAKRPLGRGPDSWIDVFHLLMPRVDHLIILPLPQQVCVPTGFIRIIHFIGCLCFTEDTTYTANQNHPGRSS